MKKLKCKILLTNISRIIRSVILINLSSIILGINKVFGIDINMIKETPPTCYADQYPMKDQMKYFLKENIFILLVPIVLIIITVIFVTKRIKGNRKIKENDNKED